RHKAQLASDRTSCRSANANQMRLILHTAAYWLLWRIQQVMPRTTALASAEFTTLRLRLLKVAARVVESASRIRIAFASACPDADLFRALVLRLKPAPT
ncbi:transposase of ISsp1, partial [Sphingomonas sp. LH128]